MLVHVFVLMKSNNYMNSYVGLTTRRFEGKPKATNTTKQLSSFKNIPKKQIMYMIAVTRKFFNKITSTKISKSMEIYV